MHVNDENTGEESDIHPIVYFNLNPESVVLVTIQ